MTGCLLLKSCRISLLINYKPHIGNGQGNIYMIMTSMLMVAPGAEMGYRKHRSGLINWWCKMFLQQIECLWIGLGCIFVICGIWVLYVCKIGSQSGVDAERMFREYLRKKRAGK